MKRFRNAALLLAAALLTAGALVPAVAAAMDADELIAKHIEAIGGAAKLKAVQTQQATGKFMTQGMEIPFTMSHKRPNLLRIEAQVMGMTMIQCYDGEKGWSINPMTGSPDAQPMGEMEEKSFKLQADMDGLLMDWKAKGYTVAYLGTDDVEGTPAHKLSLDTGEGMVFEYWFDPEYFLVLKQNSKVTHEGSEFESQTYMSDYQDVDGFMVPFAVENRMGDQVMNQIMLESVAHDVPVDATVFVMPAKAEVPAAEGK